MTLSTEFNNVNTMVQMGLALSDVDLANVVFAQYPTGAVSSGVVPDRAAGDLLAAALQSDQPIALTGGTGAGAVVEGEASATSAPAPAAGPATTDPVATAEATPALRPTPRPPRRRRRSPCPSPVRAPTSRPARSGSSADPLRRPRRAGSSAPTHRRLLRCAEPPSGIAGYAPPRTAPPARPHVVSRAGRPREYVLMSEPAATRRTAARHGRLRPQSGLRFAARILAACVGVGVLSTVCIVAIAVSMIAGSARPSVDLDVGSTDGSTAVPEIGAIEGGVNILLAGSDSAEGSAEAPTATAPRTSTT